MRKPNIRAWVARYMQRYPHMVFVPCDGKVPCNFDADGKNWNIDPQLIRTPEAADEYWTRHPHRNVGLHLPTSGMVSVDLDDLDASHAVLEGEGLYFEELAALYPTIAGRGMRLEFMAPPAPFGHLKLTWPDKDGKTDSFGNVLERGVLELRAGSLRCQDILPPSWHPDMGRAYEWVTPPKDAFPALPDSLLALWLDWPAFKRRARLKCPWLSEEERREDPEPKGQAAARQPYTGTSVVDAFNARYSPGKILQDCGYKAAGKNRWLSPDSTTGRASIILLTKNPGPVARVMCTSMSGPLADDKPHDAFDLFRILKHKRDWSAATRAAAELLGMDHRSVREREREKAEREAQKNKRDAA